MGDILFKFGEIFMHEVKDMTIRVCDKSVNGEMKDISSQKLYDEINKLDDYQR